MEAVDLSSAGSGVGYGGEGQTVYGRAFESSVDYSEAIYFGDVESNGFEASA